MKKLILFLLLSSVAFASTTPTRFRSVTSLPAACRTGDGVIPADAVVLVTGGLNILYVCASTNTWAAPVQSSGIGTMAYFPATGGSVKGDPNVTDDGSGNLTAVTFTFNSGTGIAGFGGFGQGTIPSFKTHSFYIYGPTAITTSIGFSLPTTLGTPLQTMCLNVITGGVSATSTWCNTPIAGTISLSSETSHSASFTAFNSAPACTVTPISDPTATGVWWVTSTTNSVTVHVASSGTITFNYICVGNPN